MTFTKSDQGGEKVNVDEIIGRIEGRPGAGLRYVALDGTDHLTHEEQGNMIRRYLRWRNRHASDAQLVDVFNRARIA